MPVPIQFPKPSLITFLRLGLLTGALLGAAAVWQFQAQITAEGLIVTSINFRAGLYVSYVFVGALALLAVSAWTPFASRLLRWLAAIQKKLRALGVLALVLFLLLLVAFPFIALGFYGRFLLNPFPRLFIFLIFSAVGASLLAAWRKSDWLANLSASILTFASIYLAATFLNQVTDYPFSLEWSEVSRYYQASFYFSRRVYGVSLPLPVTHPSRYLLQSIPFLIPGSSLLIHRLWQALLWVGLPMLTAWILAGRLRLQSLWFRGLFILWVFLFLMLGAVFYHLLPGVFLVLLGFDKERPWRSLLFVALASAWAGISRINWAPLPGALAALLYLLEVRPKKNSSVFSLGYLWQPALYTIGGGIVALGTYALYIANSGVADKSQFGSSFTSELLWDRLWPNDTFFLGILPGILLVSAPIFVLFWLRFRQKGMGIGLWRGIGIAALLVIFFLGGLVVSVKIGGGTNLHNLDAYMVLLLVLGVVFAFGAYAPAATRSVSIFKIPPALLTALLLMPVLFAVLSGEPLELPSKQISADILAQIQTMADQATAQGGEVLFISQRHLVTFHLIKNVPLVPEYEKLFLMEMAISHNDAYLTRFAQDIDRQRFALIITDPLFNNITDTSEDTLAPENNAWVRSVGRPILCAYEPAATFSNPAIQLLTPRYGNKCNQ
ncbi:MAG: hypothetical protein M1347_04680 [Chloroflexi bacterium]|nr:hypothetical protein [Chloroflexota bacterium]